MTVETFVAGLLVLSTFTSLITEGIKKIKADYSSNMIVAVVAIIVSGLGGIGYMIYNSMPFTPQSIIMILLFIVCTWLCAMLGYDKVKQSIEQIFR